MDERPVIDIEYGTGNLKFDKVRRGLIQNTEVMNKMGYKPRWTNDLELNDELSSNELMDRGYLPLGDCIITGFDKGGLPFTISIFPRSQRAKIHGSNHIYEPELDELREDFERFAKRTGIRMRLIQTSEQY